MSFLRLARAFTRPSNSAGVTGQVLRFRPFSTTVRCSVHESPQGYLDGKGDPRAEKPQQQGPSSDAHHNAEHTGPAPPSNGQGTGGATKTGSGTKDPSEASARSRGSRNNEAKETGSSPTGGDVRSSGGVSADGRAKPKISDMKIPDEGDADKQAEVEQHNKEFEQRYDRAPKAQADKVDKKFWSGES